MHRCCSFYETRIEVECSRTQLCAFSLCGFQSPADCYLKNFARSDFNLSVRMLSKHNATRVFVLSYQIFLALERLHRWLIYLKCSGSVSSACCQSCLHLLLLGAMGTKVKGSTPPEDTIAFVCGWRVRQRQYVGIKGNRNMW